MNELNKSSKTKRKTKKMATKKFNCPDCGDIFLTIDENIDTGSNAFDMFYEQELQEHRMSCSCSEEEQVFCDECGELIVSFNENIERNNAFSAWISQERENHSKFCHTTI